MKKGYLVINLPIRLRFRDKGLRKCVHRNPSNTRVETEFSQVFAQVLALMTLPCITLKQSGIVIGIKDGGAKTV